MWKHQCGQDVKYGSFRSFSLVELSVYDVESEGSVSRNLTSSTQSETNRFVNTCQHSSSAEHQSEVPDPQRHKNWPLISEGRQLCILTTAPTLKPYLKVRCPHCHERLRLTDSTIIRSKGIRGLASLSTQASPESSEYQ